MKIKLTFLPAISTLVTIRFITNTGWTTEPGIQNIVSNTITRQLPASAISVDG
jgi:hypothetical protein